LVYCLAGLILLCFALSAKGSVRFYLRTVLFFAASLALYLLVDGNSSLGWLKYLNIIPFLQVGPVYRYFFHLRLFAWPVGMVPAFAGALALALPLLGWTALRLFRVRDPLPSMAGRPKTRTAARRRLHTRLFRHEAYKLLRAQSGLLVVLLFLAVQGYLAVQSVPYGDANERYYRNYMEVLAGPLSDRQRTAIDREQARLDGYDAMLQEAGGRYAAQQISYGEWYAVQRLVEENTRGRPAFERVQARLAYLEALARRTGETPWFVYETGYDALTGHAYEAYAGDMRCAAVLLLGLIALFAPLFSVEYATGMIRLIACYPEGRGATVRAKLRLAAPLYSLLFAAAYLPEWLRVVRQYGLPCLKAGIASVPGLANFPFSVALWQYLALLLAVRYVMFFCALCVLFRLSVLLGHTIKTLLAATALFAAPALLHSLGVRAVDFLSFNAFFSANILLNTGSAAALLLFLIPLLSGGLALRSLRRAAGG
ncbi:MAG: hypothetical protein LBC26_05425, partial [Oscillospiraceae bacterium]|nr:hypothetical protein [Oscillospiraceae bacterium]